MALVGKITVYSFKRCPFAMRVRMVLHEKNIPFDTVEEDLKNFSLQLKTLHPEAKVPLLLHGTHVIYESSIITEYLDDAFPHSPLLIPKDAGEKAEMRLWTYWCNHIFKPTLDRYKYGTSRFSESDCVGAEEKLTTHLEKLETRLKKFEWLVGETFSLADIHVFPFYRQLERIIPAPSFLSHYPSLTQWCHRMTFRDSFKKTME